MIWQQDLLLPTEENLERHFLSWVHQKELISTGGQHHLHKHLGSGFIYLIYLTKQSTDHTIQQQGNQALSERNIYNATFPPEDMTDPAPGTLSSV